MHYTEMLIATCVIFTATRMHSADYVVARCLSVCPCVHPSVTRQYSVKTAKRIVKHFTTG